MAVRVAWFYANPEAYSRGGERLSDRPQPCAGASGGALGTRAAQARDPKERARHFPRTEAPRTRLLLRRGCAEAVQDVYALLAAALLDLEQHASHGLWLPDGGRRSGAHVDACEITDPAFGPRRDAARGAL